MAINKIIKHALELIIYATNETVQKIQANKLNLNKISAFFVNDLHESTI